MIIPEELIQFIWSQQLFVNTNFLLNTGETMKIISPGIWNKNHAGPDFESAHILIAGKTQLLGSVEIHVSDKEWYTHKHQVDKAYNAVVLHVSYYGKQPVQREDGSFIHSLSLESYISENLLLRYFDLMHQNRQLPCDPYLPGIDAMEMERLKERMSVERLEQKFEMLQKELDTYTGDWNQLFRNQVFRAFGLPLNQQIFHELAKSIPPALLMRIIDDETKIEALLWGQLQLLQSPASEHLSKLQTEYEFLLRKYRLKPVTSVLKRGGVRPAGSVFVRIAQLTHLLYTEPELIQKLQSYPPYKELQGMFRRELHKDLFIAPNPLSKKTNKIRMGKSGTDRIIINAIVPVLFFYARSRGNSVEEEIALSYFEEIPAEQNKVIQIWKERNIQIQNAGQSQGLLHLYKTYCTFKRCLSCSIGRTILSR